MRPLLEQLLLCNFSAYKTFQKMSRFQLPVGTSCFRSQPQNSAQLQVFWCSDCLKMFLISGLSATFEKSNSYWAGNSSKELQRQFSPFLPLFIPENTSSICSIAWTMWTQFLILGGSRQRTELTLVTPAPASITAAFRFSDKVPAAWSHLTHCL